MQRLEISGFWKAATWCAIALAGVAAITALGVRLHWSLSTASFGLLLLLVLQSLAGCFAASAVVAIAAVACLDYFFTDPMFSFDVASPFDLLGLACFLVVGLVITRLVTKVRAKTESSRWQQQQLQRLYELAQQLLALELEPARGSGFLEPFVGAFGVRAACVLDAVSAEVYMAGPASDQLETRTGDAFIRGHDIDDPAHNITVRCIRIAGRNIGAIGFEGLEEPSLTAGPLSALAGAQVERRHSFAHASRAAAAAQSESYRTAILDALAHEFKTPLATIMAAAGALREAGSMGQFHREMAETVESEAARLGRLTSRLIRTARLEREEIKPWMELIDFGETIAETVDYYTRVSSGRQISVIKECDSAEILADPELLRLAVSQLLDNACKYSAPNSTITLTIGRMERQVVVRVISPGKPIPPGERHRIFDRFYRGTDARRSVPGSGLGLFVARKIALALGGSLDLDAEFDSFDGVAFRFALPMAESDRHDLVATAV
jgi:two-component system, OmpR family, sensor histidine kinase KdpD